MMSSNVSTEQTSDEVNNFLEPGAKWIGYHPMGGQNFPGTTNVPHLHIIRDNGKLDNKQVLYFNPNTLSLDYSRGTEGSDIPDCSILSWKQLHLAGLNSVPITDLDRAQYNDFAKNIREEVREVALGMIESAYMDICVTSLMRVENITTGSDFRKLRSTLNTRATELLLEIESIVDRQGNIGALDESEDYQKVFYQLKDLYDFKYYVKADELAKQFMDRNNVVMRTPLNQKKRYTDFITVIFRLKLTAMHKNSFMPMFTKFSADKEGRGDAAKKVELKCRKSGNDGFDTVYLSKMKSVVPAVKREAILEKHIQKNNSYADPCSMSAALAPHQAVHDFQQKILCRVEQYFDKLGTEQKVDRQVLINLVTFTDGEFVNMLEGFDRVTLDVTEDIASVPRNSYLEQRARRIERDQARLLSLQLVDKEVADKTVRDAWNLSSTAFDNDGWCDFNTMAMGIDSDHFGVSGDAIDEKEWIDSELQTADIVDATENVANEQQRRVKGNVFGSDELLF
jgi:hypothetical protein